MYRPKDALSDDEKNALKQQYAQLNIDNRYKPLRIFRLYSSKTNPPPSQGWKLHVSTTFLSILKVGKPVIDYLLQSDIEFKIVGNATLLEELYKSPTQRGKFITIYPKDDQNAYKIAQDLDRILSSDTFSSSDFVPIKNELSLGKSGGLYARYGEFEDITNGRGLKVVDKEGHHIQDENGDFLYLRDIRGEAYKPGFVTWNPFHELAA